MTSQQAKISHRLIFPGCLLLILALLVIFKINGSSIALYNNVIGKNYQDDPNLLLGHPRSIRSDEWMVQTPWMISQATTASTGINRNIGNGLEFSMMNVPVFNWTLFFRPLFWGFYLLPIENAFSLYWWGKAFALMLASYFIALKFLNGKILPSAFLASGFLFSPFFQWWYSTAAIELVAYASILLLLVLHIWNERISLLKALMYFIGLVYFAFALLLLLYPAFQIPIIYVLVFTFLGSIFLQRNYLQNNRLKIKILIVLLAIITVVGLGLYFLKSYQEPITIVRNTVYPGQRLVQGGGKKLEDLLTGFYNVQLLRDDRTLLPRMMNQSEASSFPLFSLILLPWLVVEMIVNCRRKTTVNPLLLSLFGLLFVFLAWNFMSFPQWFSKLTLLYLVPPTRSWIGLGWLNLIIICVYLGGASSSRVTTRTWILVYSILTGIILIAFGLHLRNVNPDFIGRKIILIIPVIVGILMYLLLSKKALAFAVVFFVFSIWSSASVNPVYMGLSALTNNEVSQIVQQRILDPEQKWVVFGEIPLPNLILANGGRIYNGTFFYPDFKLVENFDPEHKYISIYNRYSHILFAKNPEYQKTEFIIIQGDVYVIKIDPCNLVFSKLGVNNFVFYEPVSLPCLTQYAELRNPNKSLFFYETTPSQ